MWAPISSSSVCFYRHKPASVCKAGRRVSFVGFFMSFPVTAVCFLLLNFESTPLAVVLWFFLIRSC